VTLECSTACALGRAVNAGPTTGVGAAAGGDAQLAIAIGASAQWRGFSVGNVVR
jgi:hypothetical protein